jgi:hypothetical protein
MLQKIKKIFPLNSKMVDMASANVLLGNAQIGGAQKKGKSSKKGLSNLSGMRRMQETMGLRGMQSLRNAHSYSKPFFGGNEWKCGQCEMIRPPSSPIVVQSMPPVQTVQTNGVVETPVFQQQPVSTSMVGGAKKMGVSQYKKYLEALSTERLHKIASGKGVKITKKKSGKTVYVKKATIIKKLCEFKHGRS